MVILLFSVVALGLGIHQYVRVSFESIPEIGESTPPGGLIVVLAGGQGRIRQSLQLIAEGKSKRLLIIGAGQGVTLERIISEKDWPVGVSKDSVKIENESHSTYENVLKIREMVLLEQLREVSVVTSYYHALRTQMMLTRLLPRWTQVTLMGVMTPNFRQEKFWLHGISIELAILESLKFAWYWAMLPQIL